MQNDELHRLRIMQQQQQQLLLQQQQQQHQQRNSMLSLSGLGGGQSSAAAGLRNLSGLSGLGGDAAAPPTGFGAAGYGSSGFSNASGLVVDAAAAAQYGGLGGLSNTSAAATTAGSSQLQQLLLQQQQQQQQHDVQRRLLEEQRRASLLEQATLEAENQKLAAALEQRKEKANMIAPGGWQSPGNDLNDRRRIIQHVLEIIQQISPGSGKSSKLNQMAQSLEGHLYQSAKTKADYMDLTTLKDRLQATAHGLESSESSAPAPKTNFSVADYLRNPVVGNTDLQGSLASQMAAASDPIGLSGLSGSGLLGSSTAASSSLGNSHGGGGGNNPLLMSNNQSNLLGAGSMSSLLGGANSEAALWQLQQQQQQQQVAALDSHQPLPFNALDTSNQGSLGSLDASSMRNSQSDLNGHNWLNLQQQMQAGQERHDSALDPLNADYNIANSRASLKVAMSDLFPQQQPQQQHQRKQRQNSQTTSLMTAAADHTVEDTVAAHAHTGNRRVIQQQQNRLLLLRHASKCTLGAACTTKFCGQMVTLWRHIKSCRDKNCKTPHCLSSRCVLNHYRICRTKGQTLTCEVCGPVMKKIKLMEREQDGGQQKKRSSSSSSSAPTASSEGMSAQQLQQLQENQTRLKGLLQSLQTLQQKQDELLKQQLTIDEYARHITDPNTDKAKHVFQQQDRLQVLQKKLHDQQQLVHKEVQALTDPVAASPSQQVAPRRNSGKGKRIGKLSRRSSTNSMGESKKKRPGLGGKDRFAVKRAKNGKVLPMMSGDAQHPQPRKDPTTATTAHSAETSVSLLACMSKSEIKKHLESLNKRLVLSPRTVTHKCRPLLQKLLDDEFAWVFRDAVDPVELGLSDYFDVVKSPMHLLLIQNRLENAIYTDMQSFAQETCLVFENAILYNGEQSDVGEVAQKMMHDFRQEFNEVVRDIESSQLNLESKGESCSLCGGQKRMFEPSTLYCQGSCGMQAIKRNASYYTDKTKQNHWCEACYNLMDPAELVPLDDGTKVRRNELQDFKNDHLPEEGWVNCDECHSWVHQICALFNGRANKSNARYCCPTCALSKAETPSNKLKRAADLPRCKLSDAIEKGIEATLEAAYAARAKELGVSVDEVEKVEGTSVRVLSTVDKKQLVGEKMFARYSSQGYPSEFPVRSKCISLFQRVHGIDTFLFALYVFEYGHDCPAPNRRRVYISYLDSVQYFEPKCYRTKVYHTVLVEYLRNVKQRGFHTAHIWSCPPTPGDDYIFYCHPKHQLVPREDMLRAWYHEMLDQAQRQGIVIRTTTLHDEYFGEDTTDVVPFQTKFPTCLPYFEGDYIPGEIENIMKRSGGTQSDTKDAVMARLGSNLAKMKDNFIVVHLRNRRFAAAVERGEDVSQWNEDSDDEMVRRKKAKISNKGDLAASSSEENPKHKLQTKVVEDSLVPATIVSSAVEESHQEAQSVKLGEEKSAEDSPFIKTEPLDSIKISKSFDTVDMASVSDLQSEMLPSQLTESQQPVGGLDDEQIVEGIGPQPGASLDAKQIAPTTEDSAPEPTVLVQSVTSSELVVKPRPPICFDEAAEADQKKRSLEAMTEMVTSYRDETNTGSLVSDTSDEDAPIESEMFESRQQFLNYCQTTHCQFDELRRAKHSTLMVLFQLHNPGAPKFLQQCGACYNDITHGIRYHCNDCNNFDLCEDCYEPITTGLWAKRDPTFSHDSNHKFTPVDMEAALDSSKNLEERQKIVQAHVELVEHAASCLGPPSCKLRNCSRMKELFVHTETCDIKPKKDCKICRRLIPLATMHSRMCSVVGSCKVPYCDRIRERNNRLKRQQQMMDDRRRQAQNELYHAGGDS